MVDTFTLLKLVGIFSIVIAALWLKRPLWQAFLLGIFLYGVTPLRSWQLLIITVQDWNMMSILIILYLLTFLQKMLDRRHQIQLALQDLNGLFNNRRINASIAPIFLGLLPSTAVILITRRRRWSPIGTAISRKAPFGRILAFC